MEFLREIKYKLLSCFLVFFNNPKRLSCGDFLVERLDMSKYFVECIVNLILVKCISIIFRKLCRLRPHANWQMVFSKLHNTRDQVTQTIGQIGVVYLLKMFSSDISIFKWSDVPGKIVAYSFNTVLSNQFFRIYYVSELF